ncbi:hypothetical protein APHAL10511_003673 [Amanita phalloides]|nr:hypothetical protein APHAL10511_003673 [Amanita phalloides]
MLTGRKSPQSLRDRLYSNSPDPLKSSILRESGMGWASTPPESEDSQNNGSITSPLRITKRESPCSSSSQVERRTSSSYRHLRNNHLVSKSPFKSQIPMPSTPSRPSSVAFPSTRRVSGEKRPRPTSIHEQAESERPFALKRERRQSKGFQNLLEKEPVSKSPFRLQHHTASSQTPPPVPSTPESRLPVASTSQSFETSVASRDHTPSPNTGPSPARSSLVSRRMHGPRLSGLSRRERRKVTFDERCDVMEFAPDEDEEDFAGGEETCDSDQQDEEDSFFHGMPSPPLHSADVPDEGASFDGIHLSDIETEAHNPSLHLPDPGIAGFVDEMFASSSAAGEISAPLRYSTPPRTADIPPELETENGVPLGRSHHAERSLQHHQQQYQSPHPTPPSFSPNQSPDQLQSRRSPVVPQSPGDYSFNTSVSSWASSLSQSATSLPSSFVGTSTPPLRRSTHVEPICKAEAEEDIEMHNDLNLPVSPSPMKRPLTHGMEDASDANILIPIANASYDVHDEASKSSLVSSPSIQEIFNDSVHEDKDDSLNLSIGNSEISITSLGRDPEALIAGVEKEQTTFSEADAILGEEPFRSLSPHPVVVLSSRSSPLARDHSRSPAPTSSHLPSPSFRATSPLSTNRNQIGSNASLTGRQRITREDVHRRLLKRRSFGSPTPETEPESKASSILGASYSTSVPWEDMVQTEAEKPEQELGVHDRTQESISTDVEMACERVTGESETSPSGADDSSQRAIGIFPANKCPSPNGTVQGRTDELDSLGVLTRMSGDDVKMDSVSSGSSGSSATVVDAVGHPSIKIEFNDVDMDMKSALDRLMDDVAGVGSREGEDSIMAECKASINDITKSKGSPLARAMTEPTPLLHTSTGIGFSPDKDRSDSSIEAAPPPLPPKESPRNREQATRTNEMEMESDELEQSGGDVYSPTAGQTQNKHAQQRLLGVGRPSRRRSMSTGDADLLRQRNGPGLLDGVVGEVANDALADSIEKELKKFVEPQKKAGYQVREREATIYASSSDPDGVSHMTGPGDVNTGKAWRAVRKPSDMNEYSKQIREFRAQEKPGKAYGKVFVKILGIKNMCLPLPHQPTSLACTLNNGIHFVSTPECQLTQNTRIDQEFELIEHNKLEFTLTLNVKRDPHIMAQFKSLSPTPVRPPPAPIVQAPAKSGMRSFFSSTPKKSSRDRTPVPSPPAPVHHMPDNLARYMKTDGTLARTFVAFKDVAARCDARLFETSYPLIGQRLEVGGKFSTQQVGELVLQIFRLPPLPGISPEHLPQSLDECCRGLRHLNWHKVTYFEGTLTQNGGDCSTWRRRRFRVIGANLVAFNDITKKATVMIDLKKAIAVEDDQQGRGTPISPASCSTSRHEYDVLCVERSFRLVFPEDEIAFFADTDEEKAKWLDIFRALVGHIPPHPLWGELLWQRHEELAKRAQSQDSSQVRA